MWSLPVSSNSSYRRLYLKSLEVDFQIDQIGFLKALDQWEQYSSLPTLLEGYLEPLATVKGLPEVAISVTECDKAAGEAVDSMVSPLERALLWT
jgi:hypothetical protein